MNDFVIGLLWGVGGALVIVPIVIAIYSKIKDAIERRSIKKQIAQGKFLKTIDPKDYDVKAWEKYIPTTSPQEMDKLNQIFVKKDGEQ